VRRPWTTRGWEDTGALVVSNDLLLDPRKIIILLLDLFEKCGMSRSQLWTALHKLIVSVLTNVLDGDNGCFEEVLQGWS
jgi:hypothetical protein